MVTHDNNKNIGRFHQRQDFFPAYFSLIFYMFCIEQAKIHREPKFGSDSAFDG